MHQDAAQPNTAVLGGARAFEFLLPIEKGIVADPRTGELYVDGPISTPRKDLQGERVLTQAVAKGLDTFLRLGGPVDYDHRSVQRQTPREFDRDGANVRFIIGHNAGIRTAQHLGRDTFFMRTKLMKGKRATADLMEHVREGGKLFYSIGGVVTDRVETPGGPVIRGTKITHVALTPYPANPDCGVTPVGISGLAKSLSSGAGRKQPMGKTLTASGQTAGLASTGGRALVNEDLAGTAPRRRKKCKGDETCTCGHHGPPVYDTNDQARGTTMGKTIIDPETATALQGLESDEHLGPIAKALKAMGAAFGVLSKGRGKDDDEDDTEDPDDKEDPESDDPDAGGNPYVQGAPMGKNAAAGFSLPNANGEEDEAVGVDAEAFGKSLLSSFGEMLHQHELRVATIVRNERKAMQKSLTEEYQKGEELQKGLRQDLEQLGMSPRPSGAYRVQGGGPGAQPGGKAPDRRFILKSLEGMAIARQISPSVVTNYEITGEIPAELQAVMQTAFAKSLAQ